MEVLVTGATGRVGAELAALLAGEGHAVRALVLPDDPGLNRVEGFAHIVMGSMQDRDALLAAVDGVDAVCHLASTLPSRGHGDRLSFEVILEGTFNLLEALRDHAPEVERFVYVSTAGVYVGDRQGGPRFTPVDEQHPLEPGMVYSAAKLGAEHLALMFGRAHGLPVAIVRPTDTAEAGEFADKASFLGRRLYLSSVLANLEALEEPGEAEVAVREQLRELAAHGEEAVVTFADAGRGPGSMTLNDARDGARGVFLALTQPEAVGEAFNIGPAASSAEDRVGGHLAAGLGIEHHSILRPLPPSWPFSSAKAGSVLGYLPQYTVFDMIDEALAGADIDALRRLPDSERAG